MSPEFVFHVRNNLPFTDDNLQTVKTFYVRGRSLFKEMHVLVLFVCLLFNVHLLYAMLRALDSVLNEFLCGEQKWGHEPGQASASWIMSIG